VLDEADRMLDMGFIPDVKRILAVLPKQRQNLLFSATFSAEIKALADKLLNRPQVIEVTPPNSTVDAIAQRVHPVNREAKSKLLAFLVGHHRWRQVLVFTRTKHGADKLVKSLHADGIGAVALHGNKSQNARTRALADFKSGAVEVMVATDIAARGIDIDQLPHVVNYDLPNVPEDYIHRIGRTGRAGADGEAISLVCVDEHVFLRDIEKLIKRSIPREVIAGFEPDPNAVAQTVFTQRGRGQQQGHRAGGGQPGAGRRGSGSGKEHRAGAPKGSTGAAQPRGGNAHAGGNGGGRSVPNSNPRAPSGGGDRARTNGGPASRPPAQGHASPPARPAAREGAGTPASAAPRGNDRRERPAPALFQPRSKTKH